MKTQTHLEEAEFFTSLDDLLDDLTMAVAVELAAAEIDHGEGDRGSGLLSRALFRGEYETLGHRSVFGAIGEEHLHLRSSGACGNA